MRKHKRLRGALRSALFLPLIGLLLSSGVSPLAAQFTDRVDVVETDPGKPPGGNQGRRPGEGTNSPSDTEGGMAPDVPTEQPRGFWVGFKRGLVKKIWNELTDDQRQLAKDTLAEWLEEEGYSSCREAAEEPEAARTAAQQFLNSPELPLPNMVRKWANTLLRISSGKGMTTTVILICNQMGL